MKFAPAARYNAAVGASMMEPTPRMMDGLAFAKCLTNSVKTGYANSPRLVNSITFAPPRDKADANSMDVSTSAL